MLSEGMKSLWWRDHILYEDMDGRMDVQGGWRREQCSAGNMFPGWSHTNRSHFSRVLCLLTTQRSRRKSGVEILPLRWKYPELTAHIAKCTPSWLGKMCVAESGYSQCMSTSWYTWNPLFHGWTTQSREHAGLVWHLTVSKERVPTGARGTVDEVLSLVSGDQRYLLLRG